MSRQKRVGEAIEARQTDSRDEWTVGVFVQWADGRGNITRELVSPIATFHTPDGDAERIAMAQAYARALEAERKAEASGIRRYPMVRADGSTVFVTVPGETPAPRDNYEARLRAASRATRNRAGEGL